LAVAPVTLYRAGMLRRLVLSIAILLAAAGSAQAADRAVIVGEVTSSVVRADLDLRAILRDAADRELRTMPIARAGAARPVIASIRLARLEATESSSSCSVTIALRRARGGALIGMLEGSARVDDPSFTGQRTAVVAAVKSALSRLGAALAN
jgi:hypothetical protein